MKNILRHITRLMIMTIIIGIIVILINYQFGTHYDTSGIIKQYVVVLSYAISIYISNVIIVNRFLVNKERNVKTYISAFVISNVCAAFIVCSVEWINYLMLNNEERINRSLFQNLNFYGTIITTLILNSIFLSFFLSRNKEKKELKEERIRFSTTNATYESLKNQLDPHFLFNSLNVLEALIEENPKKAQEFTISLSKVYRYVLEQKNKPLIAVEEELEFAQLYVNLLQMRFENAVIVNFPEKSALFELKIVPLSLQLLLENAVKHNIISQQKPLIIDILFNEHNQLEVSNTLQKKATFGSRTGIGLDNIRHRYALVSSKKAEIIESQTSYSVRLPLISEEMSELHLEESLEAEIYNRAFHRMNRLKEFYVSLWVLILLIPLIILMQSYYMYFIGAFSILAVIINGFMTINIEKKWEEKMIKRQLNKNQYYGKL